MITPEPVVIVPYNPAWPDTFASLRARLAAALGESVLAIEHVGSTSVPGLAAKPIIDIDVVIAREADLAVATQKLMAIGYLYEGERGVAGRHAFRPPDLPPKHHLYVCALGNRELERHLAFRDHLRRDQRDAHAYAALKHELAEQFGTDRAGYSLAKTPFVEDVLRKAAQRSRPEIDESP